MPSDDERVEWEFQFGLCGNRTGQLIHRSQCEELMDLIIEWAEAHDLGVGGGYGPFEYEAE